MRPALCAPRSCRSHWALMTIWLLAGPFSHLLDTTLQFHRVRVLSTPDMIAEVAARRPIHSDGAAGGGRRVGGMVVARSIDAPDRAAARSYPLCSRGLRIRWDQPGTLVDLDEACRRSIGCDTDWPTQLERNRYRSRTDHRPRRGGVGYEPMNSEWVMINGIVWLIGWPLVASPMIYLVGRIWNPGAARWAGLIALGAAWIPFTQSARDFAGERTADVRAGSDRASIGWNGSAPGSGRARTGHARRSFLEPGHDRRDWRRKDDWAPPMALTGLIIGLGCASDLFNLWVWFEAMAVSSYLLVAFYRDQPASLEAGVKYLVQSAAGSALALIGIALVLAQTGTLDLHQLQTAGGVSFAQPRRLALLAAGALFLTGLGVKTALVPMHTWLPDAHAQAPSGVSALLSGVVDRGRSDRAAARAVGIGRRHGFVGRFADRLRHGQHAGRQPPGAAPDTSQTPARILEPQSRRLYAAGNRHCRVYGRGGGAQGGFFHLVTHGLMKVLAFMAAGSLLYALHTASDDHSPLTIIDLAGAARRYSLPALALSIAVLGLGGLPPLAGFVSKWQILRGGFYGYAECRHHCGSRLRRPEQRAVARLLCATRQRRGPAASRRIW